MWLPALSACAKDYRTREHIEDPAFLRTQNAAMLRAIGEKDHKAMEQHKYRIHDFLELYPGIRKWQERSGSTAVGKKPLRLPSGRIIHTRMFEPHRPDFYKQILVSCISDFIKTLMLVAFRNGGTIYAYDRDTQTLWGHLDDPGKWLNHVADAARFAFGRPLPDHFFSVEELD